VALQYSGASEGKPLPIVLEIVVGPVDRGACIRDLSQYPREVEYLYPPMSFISPNGTPRFTISAAGLGMRVIPVRINANLSSRTVEQHVGQRKRMHCAAFRFLLCELADELDQLAEVGGAEARCASDTAKNQRGAAVSYSVEGFLKGIVRQFEEVLSRHKARTKWEYANYTVFKGLVEEMLSTRCWAVSKLRVWLENPATSIGLVQEYSLRGAHRRLIAYLERKLGKAATKADFLNVAAIETAESKSRQAALEVCKARGLLQTRIDEVNESCETPLVAAAADGASTADIRLLIAARSAINGPDGEPSTALTEAARYGRADVLIVLLEAKAAINSSTKVIVSEF
jgi:hypothetical protein